MSTPRSVGVLLRRISERRAGLLSQGPRVSSRRGIFNSQRVLPPRDGVLRASQSVLRHAGGEGRLASAQAQCSPSLQPFGGLQRRTMFIQTQGTPNPASLMFFPGKPVMEMGSSDFPNPRVAMGSPLAKELFRIDGVVRVFYGVDFVTVTKADEVSWDVIKPQVFASIMDFYTSKQPLFYDAQVGAATDTMITEDDDETVAMIKELLETRIRPAVQDDGGDIEFHGFDEETGVVKLKMQGACRGCPSSAVTLKSGIENMLKHYIPEVKGVEEFDEESEDDEAASPSG